MELSYVAESLFLSSRSGTWVYPRWIKGQALTAILKRINTVLPSSLFNWYTKHMLVTYCGHPARFGLKPKHEPIAAHPTINTSLFDRIGTGSIVPKPNISCLKPTSVVFDDNSEVAADVIIYGTGYQVLLKQHLCGIMHFISRTCDTNA